ncbi:MAG: adenylate/guanylate cyclase domain-containing protein [Actinomycetota bacterium]|nr:adenylate/guanylate cyclase domain-containing protein [Actinomycetota bacterium]
MQPLSIQQVGDRAGVDQEYVRRLIELGALRREEYGYEESDAHLVALLHTWEEAGLPPQSILTAVETGVLTLDFLKTPAWNLPEPLAQTYRQFTEEKEIPLHLLRAVHEAIGFAPPDPDDRVRPDDVVMTQLVRTILDIGASEETVRRLFRLYADNLRRLARAEAELYVAQVQKRWQDSGLDESELMRFGSEVGRRMTPLVEAILFAIYDRHRQHIWTENSIERTESALERAGLYHRALRVPAICVVDLTGYTRLTEEQGDEVAARMASNLATLVEDISRRHSGRPMRWLGDGGIFYFREPSAAVLAALEMAERALAAGLPPTHIGIQAGPVIFQDGDVYGRTVNVAARIAGRAQAGEVLTSEETIEQAQGVDVRFERLGPAELKGVAQPVIVYRVLRWERPAPVTP